MKIQIWLVIHLLLLLHIQTRCQSNLTFDETLDYINNKLETSSYDYVISYDKDIDRMTIAGTRTNDKAEFLLRNVTIVYEEENMEEWAGNHIFHEATIVCKNQKSCITYKRIILGNPQADEYFETYPLIIDNPDNAKDIILAFKQLITLASADHNVIIAKTDKNVVSMKKREDGTYEVPVIINDVLKISFIFDSGASDISISPDVALTLIRTGTIKESDFIGSQKYQFADGSIAESELFIIREFTIGEKSIKDVRAAISNSIDAPMLLGQSVLQKFGKFTIDNTNHTLTIE